MTDTRGSGCVSQPDKHDLKDAADEIERLRAVIYRLSEDIAFSPMNSSDMDELKARLKFARENLDPPK